MSINSNMWEDDKIFSKYLNLKNALTPSVSEMSAILKKYIEFNNEVDYLKKTGLRGCLKSLLKPFSIPPTPRVYRDKSGFQALKD